jgi:uncharacterized protein (TIGR04255 family)
MPNYKRPPVIEAVIEVRFGGPALDDKVMDTLVKRFSERYPAPPQKTDNVGFELAGTVLRLTQENVGFRILSADGRFTVNLGRNSLGTSRNAPYAGWDEFMEEARHNWSDWKRVVDWREVSRIGLRYINRIDVPYSQTGVTKLEEYFGFYVYAPEIPGFGAMANFAINAEIPMTDKPIKLIINHAPTPSPLVQTNSFLLDLDLGMEQALPTSEKALWETIEGLRSVKNSVFEACITDRTRELFS